MGDGVRWRCGDWCRRRIYLDCCLWGEGGGTCIFWGRYYELKWKIAIVHMCALLFAVRSRELWWRQWRLAWNGQNGGGWLGSTALIFRGFNLCPLSYKYIVIRKEITSKTQHFDYLLSEVVNWRFVYEIKEILLF